MRNVFSQDISKSKFRAMVETTFRDGVRVPRSSSDLREGYYIDSPPGDRAPLHRQAPLARHGYPPDEWCPRLTAEPRPEDPDALAGRRRPVD